MGLVLVALLLATAATLAYADVASAAPITAVDDGGPDDQPGQKDLNFLTVDYAPGVPNTLSVKWGWDDTATTGNNTRDACALFDTDGDGLANYSFCVIVQTNGTTTKLLYSCGDARADRCSQPATPIVSTSTTVNPAPIVVNSDPFGVVGSPFFNATHASAGNACDANPSCNTNDTVANSTIQLSDFGPGSTAKLINVCSYPSGEPNSDPSDCVFTPNAGFLTIVKSATPSDTTNFVFNASAGSAATPPVTSWTIQGSGSVSNITFAPTTTLDLNEVVPASWRLDSASCRLQTTGTPLTGTSTATGVDNFEIRSGLETICTFNDTKLNPSLAIDKTVTGVDSDVTAPFLVDAAGDVISYSIKVTNTGNQALTGVSVSDPLISNLDCDSGTVGNQNTGLNIAVGAFITCTGTHAATQAELDSNGGGDGDIDNTATADSDQTGESMDSADVPLQQSPALSIEKLDDGETYDSVGDVINYTIKATNTGNVTLHNVNVTDANVSDLDCTPDVPVASLAPGAEINCTASHTVTLADLDAGSFLNDACVDDGPGGAASKCDDVTTPGDDNPALSIEKLDDGETYDSVGDVINYTIKATNTGNVTLHNVNVTDANVSDLDCTPDVPVASLAPGAEINCTASHTVTLADLDAGSFLNDACVDDGPGGAASKCDDVTTPGDDNPALSIEKLDDGETYDSVGDVINYTIKATNTGNVTLTNVNVTDANVSDLDCTPDVPVASLAPGAEINCTASHTVTLADLDAGSFLNDACVDDGPGGAASKCDDVTTPGDDNPALSIEKLDDGETYDSVGDVINYTIKATNTGNVTLTNVNVTDANVSDLDCTPDVPVASLAPGAEINCTASHTVTLADLDAGSFLNDACVDDGPGGAASKCDDVTTPGDDNPALSIEKLDDGETYDSVGDVINYTIKATNTGNVTLTNVNVTDANVSDLDCTPDVPVASLAPGAEINCTASHTVTLADLDAGSFLNDACVDDGPGGAASKCDDVTTPGDDNPALSIEKLDDGETYDSVGDVINYTIKATNTGSVTLHNVNVTDANVSDLDCTPDVPVASLAPGAEINCTASHTVTLADLDAGSFLNDACVDDGPGGAASKCDDVTTPGDDNPALSIEKLDDGETYDSVGDVINYTIKATNTGNVTLHNVNVTDANVSDLDCTPDVPVASLAPGAEINCTASHTVTLADLDAGSFLNDACVDDGPGGAASKCDDVTTPGDKNPALAITKVATEEIYGAVGDVIHYTIKATNTGNVTLTNVNVTDPKVSNLTCLPAIPVASLAPGGEINCTATHTVVQADIDAGHYANTACVDDGAGGADQACANEDVPARPPVKGHIMHTGVTCSDFVSNNPSDELTSAQYGVKSGKVNNVAPGVMFYYITIQAPSSSFTINVTQSNDKGWKAIPVSGVNQIILYNANCTKSSAQKTTTFNSSTGTSSISVQGASSGATYIVGIKYSLSNLAGQAVSSPFPTVTYTFATNFGGSNLPSSEDTIIVSPKP